MRRGREILTSSVVGSCVPPPPQIVNKIRTGELGKREPLLLLRLEKFATLE